MRALLRHPAIIVFLALSLVPLALIGRNGPWFGGGAGPFLRAPAPFPRNIAPNTFRRITTWFHDRLGMRYPLMVLDSHWKLSVWRLRFRGDALFGTGAWLFFNDAPPVPASRMADLRGQLRMADADIARLGRQLAAVRAQLASCGKAAVIAIAPNKQSIYPEELRAAAGYPSSRLDDVLAKLAPDARAMVIDPRPELRAAKSRHGVPIYFPTDTHWNDLGAFIAYQKIVASLAQAKLIDRPELATLEGVRIEAETAEAGDVATRMLFLPWNYPDQRIMLRGGAAPALKIQADGDRMLIENPDGKGKLLILADSFGPWIAPLLARHFGEVEMLSRPTWPALFDGAEIARRKADVTMIEIAERSLPELLEPPRQLERACTSP